MSKTEALPLNQTMSTPSTAHRLGDITGSAAKIISLAILIIAAIIAFGPLLWTLTTSLRTPAEAFTNPPQWLPLHPDFSNYTAVFHQVPIGRFFFNSVLVTGLVVAGQTITCTLSGYAFAMIRFPGRSIIFGAFLATMMVPLQTIIIPVFVIVKTLGLADNPLSLVVSALGSAFGTFLMRQFFMQLPIEIEEAARIDGANIFQIYWRILLPLSVPGMIALGVLVIIWSWNDLLWPLVINTDPQQMPVSAGLASLQGQYTTNFPVLMAGSLLASLPVIVVFIIFQRHLMSGIAFTGIKG